jgi:hypothetical protein
MGGLTIGAVIGGVIVLSGTALVLVNALPPSPLYGSYPWPSLARTLVGVVTAGSGLLLIL